MATAHIDSNAVAAVIDTLRGLAAPERLQTMDQLEALMKHERTEAVAEMRAESATWQEIADAAGVTRQAAHQHYAPRLAAR